MNLKNEIPSSRPVAIWLLTGVGMIMIQVVLGGITRLTGSGLSITEWKPLLGTLPPLNEASWQQAFDQYKHIGQFKKINFDFSLSEFKFIYFWDWFKRK
jgi:cytochrome c oxidase assembly protein subunit 15